MTPCAWLSWIPAGGRGQLGASFAIPESSLRPVSAGRPQSADELLDDAFHRSFVTAPGLDAFLHELLGVADFA